MKKLWKAIKTLLTAAFLILPIVLIGFVLAAHITGDVPTLFGYSTSVVVSPSMSDVLPVGSILLNKEYHPGDELEKGDIITYLGVEGSYEGKLITHKIESITEDGGSLVIVTKGTMNTAEDPAITESDVKSVLVCKLISLGKLYTWIQQPIGFLFLIVIPIMALIAYELWNFRRNMEEDKEENETAASQNEPK